MPAWTLPSVLSVSTAHTRQPGQPLFRSGVCLSGEPEPPGTVSCPASPLGCLSPSSQGRAPVSEVGVCGAGGNCVTFFLTGTRDSSDAIWRRIFLLVHDCFLSQTLSQPSLWASVPRGPAPGLAGLSVLLAAAVPTAGERAVRQLPPAACPVLPLAFLKGSLRCPASGQRRSPTPGTVQAAEAQPGAVLRRQCPREGQGHGRFPPCWGPETVFCENTFPALLAI